MCKLMKGESRCDLVVPQQRSSTTCAHHASARLSGPRGAITAALYLNEFVEARAQADGADTAADAAAGAGDTQPPAWLHIDMMAYNNASKPGRPEGGEAMGVRALFRLLASRYPR